MPVGFAARGPIAIEAVEEEELTTVTIPGGLLFPSFNTAAAGGTLFSTGTNMANNAAAQKFAFIGQLAVEGRATGKVLDTSGSSAIGITLASTFVLGDPGTSVDVGIQDVDTAAGPPARGDGTFDVKAVVTSSTGGLTAGLFCNIVPTTGTKTMSHGDRIAVVFDMTARVAPDVFSAKTGIQAIAAAEPAVVFNTSGTWTTLACMPCVVITFSDGTLATIDDAIPFKEYQNSDPFDMANNPDERGMMFQIPFDCEIDALFCTIALTDANADFALNIYSNPTGSPSLIGTVAFFAEQRPNNASLRRRTGVLAAPVALTADTDYAVVLQATGTGDVNAFFGTLGATGHRIFLPYGLTGKKVTRNDQTGAFSVEGTPLSIYELGVRICSFQTPA